MRKSKDSYAIVEGSGEFPYDMLRYDNCTPARERDSYEMVTPDWVAGRRRLIVRRQDGLKWTPNRWNSFGWQVMRTGAQYEIERELGKLPELTQ